MSKPLNVCLVAPLPPSVDGPSHSCGGIVHWTQMIMRYAEGRDDVLLSVVDTTPSWRAIHNFSLWKRAVSGGLNLAAYMTRLFGKLLSRRLDVIHMTTSGELGVVRDITVILTGKLFRVPVIYHIRFGRVPDLTRTGGLEWQLLALAMRMAKAVVAIDEATYLAIRTSLPCVNAALIPNCIDTVLVQRVEGGEFAEKTVLFAGWVIPAKGVAELLKAWSALDRSGWRLNIVGPVSPEYERQLSASCAIDNVSFLGEKPHAETLALISACDVFVLPSYSEGFPNAVLEAMALGKPIVATSVGAIPEMLAKGAGCLVPPKDAAALQAALQSVIDDVHLRKDMGSYAKARAFQNYSIEIVFDRYVSLWRGSVPIEQRA